MSREFCRCGAVRECKQPCPACGAGRKHHGTHRRTTAQRGYDNAWRTLSERVRADEPLCVDCLDKGKVSAVEHVHHIVPISEAPQRRLDRSNLVALCSACHRERESAGGTMATSRHDSTGGWSFSQDETRHDRSAPEVRGLAKLQIFRTGGE